LARPDSVSKAPLDASAVIGVMKADPYYAPLKSLLAAIARNDVTLVASTAMLVEVRPTHDGDTAAHPRARDAARALLESPGTEMVDVNLLVARRAGELADKYGLHTWDAVHLATAVLTQTDVMVARDQKLPEGDYEGVWVTGPFDIDSDKLFGGAGEGLT
jgi:predicted nucleic acid-binding protein